MTAGPGGILVADKPAGFTSFDVVAKLRGICGTKKIGHGGTLDPMATGVLPVFVGAAVKAVDLAPNQDKVYEAEVLFGTATDTGDITGKVVKQGGGAVPAERLSALLPHFTGELLQTPPMYSAVKVGGKPLYRYAREGVAVQRKRRRVVIHELVLLGQTGENRFALRVVCSKGTYIRTLCEDIGAALGSPAVLAALRRTRAGAFGLKDAHTLGAIQAAKNADRLEGLLLPVDVLFCGLPALEVGEPGLRRLQNGAPVYGLQPPPGRCRALCEGRFIGLVQGGQDGAVRVEKLFVTRPSGEV